MAKKETKKVAPVAAVQEPKADPLQIVPIWKDLVYSLGTTSDVPFKLRLDNENGKVIYSGVAKGLPGSFTEIIPNDIIADYLYQADVLSPVIGDNKVFQKVSIELNNSGIWTPIALFQYDWSYMDVNNVNGIYSAPVTGKISPFQKLVFSASVDGDYTWTFVPVDGSPDIRTSYGRRGVMQNWKFEPVTKATRKVILNDGIELNVTEGCERYVLYYVNAFGGWDSLLIEGSGFRTDGIERKSYKRSYVNSEPKNRGRVNYQNNITRRMELHTGLMTGDQGSRMHHLLESTMVYLHDMVEDSICPVNITDSECIFKDYKNNGGQLFEYTINLEISRDYKRK